MKIISAEKLIPIFGHVVPPYAMAFMLSVPDDMSEEQMLAALATMHKSHLDPRIRRALTIAKTVYADKGKTFEETYNKEDGGKILTALATVLIAVFEDMDRR
jgi:hypothetical protein